MSTIADVSRAYEAGIVKGESPVRRPQVSLTHVLLNRFSLRDRLYVRKVLDKTCQGVSAARKGKLNEAERLLAAGQAVIHLLSEEGRFLAVSMLESAQAYLDYREDRYDVARERLLLALDMDLLLEQAQDYALLEMHRVQIAQNIVRIDLRAGCPRHGFALAGSILAYLEGRIDHLPIHRAWQT